MVPTFNTTTNRARSHDKGKITMTVIMKEILTAAVLALAFWALFMALVLDPKGY